MRIEHMHMRNANKALVLEEGVDVPVDFVPCAFEDADITMWVFTDIHPVDRHEFGLSLTVAPAERDLDARRYKYAVDALVRYLEEHPDGEDT